MVQEEMQFGNPIYKKTDPVTSREAAEDVTRSGKRSTNAQTVLDTVRALPGSTGTELYKAIPSLNLYAVRRRLSDLLHKDLVRQGERNGRELTWWPNS